MGAERGNRAVPCPNCQSGRSSLEEYQAVAAETQQAQNLSCERDSNDIDRKASITRNLGCVRHQNRLP